MPNKMRYILQEDELWSLNTKNLDQIKEHSPANGIHPAHLVSGLREWLARETGA
jgi:hypothetical protein